MKTLTFLAVLILGSTALAGHRHNSGGGHSHGGRHGHSSVRVSYGQPYYSGYRTGYYRSYPYRTYPYRSYYGSSYYGSGYYRPGLSFTYVSGSPQYYGGYAPSYRNSGYYSDSISIEAQVQRELKRRGYYRGYVDGDIGPASRSAIRSWQYERGLAVTGRVDRALLRSLGI
jgi:hypothetical protein